MTRYGLIGFPLTHSFSQRYFTEKFRREGVADSRYDLFEMPDIRALPDLLALPDLRGLNVTIPHKQAVMPYIDRLDATAEKIGAVNVIKLETDGSRTGYNSDYYGFRQSLTDWLTALNRSPMGLQALVLGTGGASKAVTVVLADLGISYKYVSRAKTANTLIYPEIANVLGNYQLVINASPVGTYPHIDAAPNLPYHLLTEDHLLYDLVYNPLKRNLCNWAMHTGRPRIMDCVCWNYRPREHGKFGNNNFLINNFSIPIPLCYSSLLV